MSRTDLSARKKFSLPGLLACCAPFALLAFYCLARRADYAQNLRTVPSAVVMMALFAAVPGVWRRVFRREGLWTSLAAAAVLTLLHGEFATRGLEDLVVSNYFYDAVNTVASPLTRRAVIFALSFAFAKEAQAAFAALAAQCAARDDRRRAWPVMAAVFALCLAGLVFLWKWHYYPFVSHPDTLNQWQQIHGAAPYADLHAPFHTLVLKVLLKIRDNYGFVVQVQLVAVSAVYALLSGRLLRRGVPSACLLAAALVCTGAHWCAAYMFVWKDVFYTVCLCFLTWQIMLALDRDALSVPLAALMGLTLAVICLLRYNGLVCLVFTLAYFAIVCVKRRLFKPLAALVCACAVALGAANAVLYGPLGCQRETRNGTALHVAGAGIAAVVAQNGRISEEELAWVDQTLGVDWIRTHYSPWHAVNLVWTAETNDPDGYFQSPANNALNNFFNVGLGEHKMEALKTYLSLFVKNPGICLRELAYGTWQVWGNFGLFSNAGITVTLLLALWVMRKKIDAARVLPVFLPFACNALSIAVSTITNEGRYLLPSFALFLPLLLYILSSKKINP